MLTLAAAALCAGSGLAGAQTPTTPLRVILPVGAGSGVDTIMRSAQVALSKALGGQPVVIENLTGARDNHLCQSRLSGAQSRTGQ